MAALSARCCHDTDRKSIALKWMGGVNIFVVFVVVFNDVDEVVCVVDDTVDCNGQECVWPPSSC